VQLLGVRPHAELPSLLRQAALFVLPSSYEGHPKAIIEAMSCGLPVIAGDSRGVNVEQFSLDRVVELERAMLRESAFVSGSARPIMGVPRERR
jgi:Glycosyl transferases group 1